MPPSKHTTNTTTRDTGLKGRKSLKRHRKSILAGEIKYISSDSSSDLSGSFGVIREAYCRGKKVAVKRIQPDKTHCRITEQQRKDFKNEVSLLDNYSHENIVQFYGSCEDGEDLLIITEFVENGNLAEVLLNHEIPLSLPTRFKMATDIALGMNWLHQSEHVFIHQDLKLENLLVGENNIIKICDFGLSIVKNSPSEMVQSKDCAKGSIAWMAPELLAGQEYDETVDVYSYGLILWSLLTREYPFDDYTENIKAFCRDICNNMRPDLSKLGGLNDYVPSLPALMKQCWHADPNERPSFEMILQSLRYAFVDVCLFDNLARKIWLRKFLCEDKVKWDAFYEVFENEIPQVKQHPEFIQHLKQIIAVEKIGDGVAPGQFIVTIERFGAFIERFGPLVDAQENPVVINTLLMCTKEPWFHGDISRETSNDRLRGRANCFLVRFSNELGCFALSYTDKDKQIHNMPINYVDSTNLACGDYRGTLPHLLASLKEPLQLLFPATGSCFQTTPPEISQPGLFVVL